MRVHRRRRTLPFALCVASLAALLLVGSVGAATELRWQVRHGRVDAAVDRQPLTSALAGLAAATGWQVFVEPRTQHMVALQCRGLPTADALRRLLDGLSFALLPQHDGPDALFVFRGTVADATERIQAGRPDRVPSTGGAGSATAERIIVLRPGADGDAAAIAARAGGSIVGQIDGLRAYRLRFPTADAAAAADGQLARDPAVASLETNETVSPPATLAPAGLGTPPLGLEPDVRPASDRVIVGLIDTAVQRDGTGFEAFLEPSVWIRGEQPPTPTGLLHGTAMARTILDTVADALTERGNTSGRVALSILPIDVYGGEATTDTFSIAQGLYEALNRHVNVINLSLGGYTDSPLIRQLTQSAARHGVVVVAAAGNDAATQRMYPAADPGVIAVTASDASGGIASYANRGPWVDAIAPGDNTVSVGNQSWSGSGTSFATSRVSGWAAGYLASGRVDPRAATRLTLGRWAMAGTPR